jgi:hypothetical protein
MDKYYLIEHDRHGKVPTRITEYCEFKDAEERLCKLDIDQMDELNACLSAGKPVRMEYVVICAQSVVSVKQTHARYFQSDYEVLTPREIRYAASGKDREPATVVSPVPARA